jgi:hypothetical protein
MRAPKRDRNEPEVIAALEARGCEVEQILQGDGAFDLIVWSPARGLFWLEVKDGTDKRLTPKQEVWTAKWKHMPREVAHSAEMAVRRAGLTW